MRTRYSQFSLFLLLCIAYFTPQLSRAQEIDAIDESALFGDGQGVLVDSTVASSLAPRAHDTAAQPVLLLGGDLTFQLLGAFSDKEMEDPSTISSPRMRGRSVGVLTLDARTPALDKAFAAVEAAYAADSSTTDMHLRELFLDWNLGGRVWLRAGKQVLQWGRCYFWNPSDLINVEKRAVVERAGTPEGVAGLKAHVPWGTAYNVVAFVDMGEAGRMDEMRYALKNEFLLGRFEISAGLWKKSGLAPVWAVDLSSALAGWEVAAEAAAFPAAFLQTYNMRSGLLYAEPSAAWTPQVAVSAGRSFRVGEINDRLRVQYELFYNGLGYTGNPVADTVEVEFAEPLQLDEQISIPHQGSYWRLERGTPAMWILASGNYRPYQLARWYAGTFWTFSRFVVQELTLGANGIVNLMDRSYLAAGTFSYTTLQQLTLSLTVLYAGGEAGEMNVWGDVLQGQIQASLAF
jgi:hypothetical protein